MPFDFWLPQLQLSIECGVYACQLPLCLLILAAVEFLYSSDLRSQIDSGQCYFAS